MRERRAVLSSQSGLLTQLTSRPLLAVPGALWQTLKMGTSAGKDGATLTEKRQTERRGWAPVGRLHAVMALVALVRRAEQEGEMHE